MIDFNVTELIEYIKLLTSNDYVLNNIRVEGEVSNLNLHSNGNAYFSLKDEYSKINVIIYDFKSIENIDEISTGSLVQVDGSVSILESDGSIRITGTNIKNIGIGNLYEQFLKTKSELEKEGYFLEEHKKPIPKFPKKIGVITSIDGAAINDIYNVSTRRNPYINIEHFPSLVQGNYAVNSLIRGLDYFERSNVDLVIIGRGGGSYEDLNAFNDRELAIKIYNFNKPIISAVGHEHDFTISDFVSDLRAPTPSAAAELAFFSHDEFIFKLNNEINNLTNIIYKKIENENKSLDNFNKRLNLLSLDKLIEKRKKELLDINIKLSTITNNFILKRYNELGIINLKIDYKNIFNKINVEKNKLNNLNYILNNKINLIVSEEEKDLLKLKNRLDKLDMKSILNQGYSLVTDENNKLLKDVNSIEEGDNIKVILYNGNFDAEITKVRAD